ncbi:MAG TPA: hypothetical protein IAB00_02800 [Candidatus Avidehalobacter gallistercoris]|uniref:Uncharacterized protein n=1 Tax=Candidatus Avidehalobacter gallistercoris TaxID=2840694 RepID=A0A9D1HIW3_9FIRM|nr:hypothetical protein [Candidatus Avidehalobacter gallistercoris]
MDKYKTGDMVYAKLGTLPVVGTIIYKDDKTEKYLIRFSTVQQDWYSENDIIPYKQG